MAPPRARARTVAFAPAVVTGPGEMELGARRGSRERSRARSVDGGGVGGGVISSTSSRPPPPPSQEQQRRRRQDGEREDIDPQDVLFLDRDDLARLAHRVSIVRSTRPAAEGDETAQSSRKFAARLRKWWGRRVRATVGHEACRDHFALERTWLSWQRTSLAFSILGISVAQLFTLTQPAARVERRAIGIPLAAGCISLSILVSWLGAVRFWRQQQAIVLRDRVHAGGWEQVTAGLATLAVSLFFSHSMARSGVTS